MMSVNLEENGDTSRPKVQYIAAISLIISAIIILLYMILFYSTSETNETNGREGLNIIILTFLLCIYIIHFIVKKRINAKLFSFVSSSQKYIFDHDVKDYLNDEFRIENRNRKPSEYLSPIKSNQKKNGCDIDTIVFKFIMLSIGIPVLLSFAVSYLDETSLMNVNPSEINQNCIIDETDNSVVQAALREKCVDYILQNVVQNNDQIDKYYLLKQTFIIVVIVLITVEFSVLLSLSEQVYSGARFILLTSLALDVTSLLAISVMGMPEDGPTGPNFQTFFFILMFLFTIGVIFVSAHVIILAKRLDDKYNAICKILLNKTVYIGSLNQIARDKEDLD